MSVRQRMEISRFSQFIGRNDKRNNIFIPARRVWDIYRLVSLFRGKRSNI